jgi:anti-sigma regulatory factor (Ser/Thr protein kinase)
MAGCAGSRRGALRLRLRPTTGSVRAARHQVIGWARDRGLDDDGEHVVALLTSELVTNAVRHAAGEITLDASTDGGRLTVEVGDGSTRRPSLPRQQPATASGGRGMALVDRLAAAWGVRPTSVGKAVWFAVDLPGTCA